MTPPDDGTRREFLAAAGAAGIVAAGAASVRGAAQDGQKPPLAPPDEQPPDLNVPEPTEKIGWAIVGLGTLALNEIMPAFAEAKFSKPAALVSGHPDKAKQVARVYDIEPDAIYDYDSYDRLAEDDRVQAVYIVLPNSMHAEYTIRGLKAGKHVLCEKPMAVTVAECERMIAAAEEAQRKLMIAYRLHYEPFNRKVMELCRDDAVGKLRTYASSFCQNVSAPNIRLSADLGGGPVGDVGVYSINAARYCVGEEPTEVTAVADDHGDPRFREVPGSVAYTMRFPSGVVASCDCSFAGGDSARYRVHGSDGHIGMDPAFPYRGQRLFVAKGNTVTEHELTPVNQFASEMDHFSQCIQDGKQPRTPGAEGLADMKVVVAIHESYRNGGKPVQVG